MLKYANFDRITQILGFSMRLMMNICVISGPFAVIDEHFGTILPNSFDAIGLMLMIRIIHQHQVYP